MPPATRKIIHVDMDAFFAAVEQRDAPELRGRPVVVAWRGARSVVCAASYEARRFGVRSAMPALTAERLCPDAVFVAPDFARYKAISRQIRAIFARHARRVEPLSLDEAYLDVTEPLSPLPSATAIAAEIRASIFRETALTASAGVAGNKFIAKVASDFRKPDGLTVVRPRDAQAFLAPLAVGCVPGVGKVMAKKLAALGIHSIADLRAHPRAELEQRFGRFGVRLGELAQGIDERPVDGDRPTQQISSEDTFEEDLPLAALEPFIRRLAEHAWAAHERHAAREPVRVARTVVLKLKTADFHTLTRSLTPPTRPVSMREVADIACALRERVERPAQTRYRLVGVGLAGFVERDAFDAQRDLFA